MQQFEVITQFLYDLEEVILYMCTLWLNKCLFTALKCVTRFTLNEIIRPYR